jgi:hypothetical protein
MITLLNYLTLFHMCSDMMVFWPDTDNTTLEVPTPLAWTILQREVYCFPNSMCIETAWNSSRWRTRRTWTMNLEVPNHSAQWPWPRKVFLLVMDIMKNVVFHFRKKKWESGRARIVSSHSSLHAELLTLMFGALSLLGLRIPALCLFWISRKWHC